MDFSKFKSENEIDKVLPSLFKSQPVGMSLIYFKLGSSPGELVFEKQEHFTSGMALERATWHIKFSHIFTPS